MRADIELALDLAQRRLPDLKRFPKRLKPAGFRVGSRILGQYNRLTDTISLNARYLGILDDDEAHELLDTVIHELLHANSSLWTQVRDTFFAHPHVYAEARRLALALVDEFHTLRRRGGEAGLAAATEQRDQPTSGWRPIDEAGKGSRQDDYSEQDTVPGEHREVVPADEA